MSFCRHLPSRRELLIGSGALFAWTQMPKLARAEGRDPRLLVIVLRGALDGLGAVAPVGDPDWIGLRGDRALVLDGKTPALPLDAFFALNPAMPNLHRLYKAQQASIVHAAATPYRERSHFDGQDVLESGVARPGAVDTGWLNRALVALASDGRVDLRGSRALGVGPVTPLVVRGQAPVMSWVPQKLLAASDDTQARLLDLYQHTDPRLAVALEARMRLAALGPARGADDPMSDDASLAPPGIAPCAPISPRLPARLAAFSRNWTVRASAPWDSSDGIRTPTRAPRPVSSPICWALSTERSPPSRPTWARHGARR
jgi:uncharacterized protein (DUF1501 family)